MTLAPARYEHRYRPRGTARRILLDRSPELLVSGPAGTGKSRACLEKLAFVAKKYDGMRGLILRKTARSLGSTALATWRTWVVDKDLLTGEVDYYGGSQEEPPQYRFANGSKIMIGGLDNPTRIMSSEYDVAYVQEATELRVDDWEAINTRLRNGVMPYQQLIADCNPDAPHHWLYTRCEEGSCIMLHSTHEENPRLFDEIIDPDTDEPYYVVTEEGQAYIARLDALTGVRYLRLRLGRWVAAEGVIYDEFDPRVHVIEPFAIPDHWPRFWSVDFGYVNPFVLQCWAEDDDGRLYLYRELYATGKTVDQHARDIIAAVSDEDPNYVHPVDRFSGKALPRYAHHGRIWREPKPRTVVCDHDAEGRAQLLRELNMTTKAADKRVLEGIQAVQVRLRDRADGRPGLFIFKGATVQRDQSLVERNKPASTSEEVLSYVWDTGADGKLVKDAPKKENDHGCDAKRYLVVYRDPIKRAGVRGMGE